MHAHYYADAVCTCGEDLHAAPVTGYEVGPLHFFIQDGGDFTHAPYAEAPCATPTPVLCADCGDSPATWDEYCGLCHPAALDEAMREPEYWHDR